MTSVAPVLTVVDPAGPSEELSVDELGLRIVGMAGRLAAATCRWLLLVAEFDQREGYSRYGLWSTARWLSHHCGLARRTAVEHVRVARALAMFPQLAAEMSAGRLSYSQVRAISRLPREGEHRLVDDLIEVARHGTAAQLESVLQGMRTADHAATGHRPENYVRTGWTSSAQWSLSARLDPEDGALIDRALGGLARAEQITKDQALTRMAEICLAALTVGDTAQRALRDDELTALVVHVDAASYPGRLRSAERIPADGGGEDPAAPAGRIADGPGLSRRVIERLVCAGRVRTVVHGADGSPLDVGRSHRLVTAKQFRALLLRDGGCVHPGCGSRRNLHAHHVRHWLHGGRTDLANLVLLCEAHHRALHDGEFRIERVERLGPGRRRTRWRFLRRDGHELPALVRPGDHPDAPTRIEADFVTDPTAPTSRWGGERLDRHWAVSVLAERRARAS